MHNKKRQLTRNARNCFKRYVIIMRYLLFLIFLGSNLANSSDFVEAKRSDFSSLILNDTWGSSRLVTKIEYDFDGDKVLDKVILEINSSKTSYRVTAYISSSDMEADVLWKREIDPSDYHGIWELMWLKAPGSKGESEFKYFNAPGKSYPYLSEYTDMDIQEYKEAVKYYESIPAIEATEAEEYPYDLDGIYYCRQQYYFENGTFKKLSKCD